MRIRKFGIWVSFWLVFCVFPLFVAELGLEKYEALSRTNHRTISQEKLTERLESLQRQAQRGAWLYDTLEKAGAKVELATDPVPALQQVEEDFSRRFPGVFSFHLVASSGDALFHPVEGEVRQEILRHLYLGLKMPGFRESVAILDAFFQERSEDIQRFLGEKITLGQILNQSFLREVSPASDLPEVPIFFHHVTPRFGLFCFIKTGRLDGLACIREILASLNARSPGLLFGIYDPNRPDRDPVPPGIRNCLGEAVRQYEESLAAIHGDDQNLVVVRPGPAGLFFWGWTDLAQTRLPQGLRQAFSAGLLLLGLVLGAGSFLVIVRETPMFISIRWKLVGLFMFSSGLPLIVLGFTSYEFLLEKQQNLKNQIVQQMGDYLQLVDDNLPRAFARLLRRLHATYPPGQRDPGTVGARILEGFKDLNFQDAVIVDQEGRKVFSSLRGGEGRSEYGLLASILYKGLMNHNQLRQFGVPFQDQPGSGMERYFGSFLSGLVLKRVGEIQLFSVGGMAQFLFVDFLRNDQGLAEYALAMTWRADAFSLDYLRGIFGSDSSARPFRVLGIHETTPQMCWPAGIYFQPWVRECCSRLRSARSLISGAFEEGGESFLSVGLPGKNLSGFFLIASFPTRSIADQIFDLRFRLGMFALFFFITALAVAFAFARSLLVPMKHLSNGVAAIETRDFSYVVPRVSNDELGQISQTFNQMIEGLRELATAQALQTMLSPGKALALPGFEIYGRCLTFSELGGDYFDYFPVGEQTACVVIGDVSGHGVRSALLMAMAKAIVWDSSKRGVPPEGTLERLEEMIRATVGREMMLTMIISYLDLPTGRLSLHSAGHCHPFITRDDGSGEIATPPSSFPLGMGNPRMKARGQKRFGEFSTVLHPNDRVFFYTDGLPEILSPAGKQFGYDPLEELFRSCRADTPEGDFVTVMTTLQEYHGGPSREDDMTLIVVQRKKT
ncbi:MAG: SpoIIE family protein phosphatase [Candidatus Riflebacteria bacterium]|nr:SpoIIE family protein phosphatase [Candidatus Riflebacteria bacterium]